MAIDLEDEILQDFLVEAGEILELLGEQLVELEQSPEDFELLNAIFRGFHTIKGGAGFLALDSLVSVCHKAEDVFDVLREGERKINAELMDVILEVVDVVNLMFDQVKAGNEPEAADERLLVSLQGFTREGLTAGTVEVQEPVAEPEKEVIETPAVADEVEQEFATMLDDTFEEGASEQADNDEITEEEFDSLLDDLHGKGQFSAPALKNQEVKDNNESAKKELDSGDISEEEFDNLLDELHGKGKFSASSLIDEEKEKIDVAADSGEITEEEFDNLLDDLHGKGKFNGAVTKEVKTSSTVDNKVSKTVAPVASAAESKQKPEPVKNKPEPEVIAPVVEKPAANKVAAKPATPKGETTVRVDTEILDDIMNMVGELVLVRNRFQTLKATSEQGSSEHMAKAVANLDVVTADLQLAVMKTRMQPIKKVFGRFPRVVRDLSRSLKKEIRLELVGEETDLDKNLVEALADPLVHLVRNAVDHGVESPDDRVAVGKPREGLVVLTASQEGDHIMLSIKDDGKGMNADHLRKIVVEKGLMDEETAARLEDKECYNLIFMPGFSTKVEISDVSGRGVGMDVVRPALLN